MWHGVIICCFILKLLFPFSILFFCFLIFCSAFIRITDSSLNKTASMNYFLLHVYPVYFCLNLCSVVPLACI